MEQSLSCSVPPSPHIRRRLHQVFYVGRPCRCQVAEVRGLLADSIRKVNLQNPCRSWAIAGRCSMLLVEAAQSHIYRQGVEDGILCHNVSWTDILLPQFHDLHACLLRQTNPCRVDCRNGSVAAKSHAKALPSGSSCCWPCTCRNRIRRSDRSYSPNS